MSVKKKRNSKSIKIQIQHLEEKGTLISLNILGGQTV